MNRNVILLSLTSILISMNMYSQSIYGTFVAMAICKDGILVLADSRSSLKNDDGDFIGYIDETQKIWKIENFLMANQGISSYGERSHIYISRILEKSESFSNKINILIPELLEIIKSKSTKEDFDSYLKEVFLFAAGFEEGVPFICIRNNYLDTCLNSSYIMSAEIGVDPNSQLYNATEYLKLIEEKLIIYVKIKNLECSIGGPNAAYIIRKDNNIENLQNPFEDNDYFVCQTLIKALNNKLPYYPIDPHNIKEVSDFLKKSIKNSLCEQNK